jgi:death-on-curing protein
MAQIHFFIDGNKRTAFALHHTVLSVNSVRISADADETSAFIIGLHENGTFEFTRLCRWLRQHHERAVMISFDASLPQTLAP